ncbi:MAG TPA: hypothetical protein VD931_22910 [Baekduia sp.]|nr:hypothetical protein [Baekduia sp.]
MQTMTVHAHFLTLAEQGGVTPPNQWRHDLVDGSLSFRYAGSPNSFAWDAEAIASMTGIDDDEPSAAARELLVRWEAVEGLLARTGRRPTVVLVDHDADELTLCWNDEKLAVIIGPDDEVAGLPEAA